MKVLKLFDYRNIIKVLGAALGIYLCLRYANDCSRGILNGILFCIQVLVPSLFLFMVLAAVLVKSGAAEVIAKPLHKASLLLFKLPYPALSAILLAAVGGYPIGARCAAMLYEEGRLSGSDAEKTAFIAVCAGPGFLINFVGRGLLGSPEAGTLLLFAQITATVLTGMIVGRVIKSESLSSIPKGHPKKGGNLLISSVSDASRATFQMCSMVVICAALIEVIAVVSPSHVLTDIASAAVEITTGCGMLCGRYPLTLIAFFVGFGGISVHLQIYAGCGRLTIRKGLFFLFRVVQGIITAVAAYIYLMIFPVEVSVFNSADLPLTAAKSATLIGSAALVIAALCFVGTMYKHQLRR